ncbi:MAG: YciI family protein [Acidobacteria bacterium]|nr:YciI family protein [Acidobacteriota bacterium]
MRFMLIVYLDEEAETSKSDAERDEMFRRCFVHSAEWKRQGVMEAGEPLHPTSTSTTVRVRGGKTILTDGPFAETKEQLGGYYIVDCANEQDAVRLAAEAAEIHRNPFGAIEVRPILEFSAP